MTERSHENELARFLTLADVAEILSVSAGEVLALIRSGELPAIRVGQAWRIESAVLEDYIQEQYEANRRTALWRQGEFANVIDVDFGSDQSLTSTS